MRRGISPRAAIPRGTVDRRFRGDNCGRGANLTLRVGNEEEEAVVVVGRFEDRSKEEDVDNEICLFKGISVGCESRDSTSSAMDFVRLLR